MTGMLAAGKPRLALVVEPGGVNDAAEGCWTAAYAGVLRLTAIAEAGSGHPLARPIVEAGLALGHANAGGGR